MTKVLLNVPHYDQNDNDNHLHGPGWRQCNLTSHAMALDYLTGGDLSRLAKKNGMNEAESYYGFHLNKYGDTINHDAHTQVLTNFFKIPNYWKRDGSCRDLRKQLDLGKPVPIGVHYKSSGHIICVIGYDDVKKVFYVNDPYGVRAGASNQYHTIGGYSGACDTYSYSLMVRLFCSNKNDGWMRVFE
jgi:uncharacterized protein YvpB